MRDIERSAYEGIGRPESLRGNLSGQWSHRIDDVNCLVYRSRAPRPSKRSLPGLKYVESQGSLSPIERREDRIVVRLLTIGPGAPILQLRSA
nr:type II toxin-antitoxin system YoeB family toxin [uncultured Fretibacterium sp.]